MLSNCVTFTKMANHLSSRNLVPKYSARIFYRENRVAIIRLVDLDRQEIETDEDTYKIFGRSMAEMVKVARKYIPDIKGFEAVIETNKGTYSQVYMGPITNPEIVTLVFKQVVFSIGEK